jgi:hypothetical protein
MTSDSSSEVHEPRVFVSYVREDRDIINRLAKELSAYGIKVWLDKTELNPGYRWKDAIREAISEGDFFIACFSEAYQRRLKSYMNEELALAIEELRQRPTDRAWFIPVLLSGCDVPARSIGAGETLRDIQWVELHRNWEDGIARIAAAIDPNAQISQPPRVWQLKDSEWDRLIRYDRFTPILGRGINYGIVPADSVLARKWARELDKPEWIGLTFSQVMENMATTLDPAFVHHKLIEEYSRARLSEFDAAGEPHAVLSRLPCKLFITACIDRFMEDALTSQGKNPRSVILRTRRRKQEVDPGFEPTFNEPLVVHTFGRLDEPHSVPVTLDDKMEILQIDTFERNQLLRIDSPHIWLGFNVETIEDKIMYNLMEESTRWFRPDQQWFSRGFNYNYTDRPRILLRDFMAEWQARWEMKSNNDGGL